MSSYVIFGILPLPVSLILNSYLLILTPKCMSAQCIPLLIFCWLRNQKMKLVKTNCRARVKRDLVGSTVHASQCKASVSSYKTRFLLYFEITRLSPRMGLQTGDVTMLRTTFYFFQILLKFHSYFPPSHELLIILAEISGNLHIRVLSCQRGGMKDVSGSFCYLTSHSET